MENIYELIALEKYYREIADTYRGGCMTIPQGEASRKAIALRESIDEYYKQLNISEN